MSKLTKTDRLVSLLLSAFLLTSTAALLPCFGEVPAHQSRVHPQPAQTNASEVPGKDSVLSKCMQDLSVRKVDQQTFDSLVSFIKANPHDALAHSLLARCYNHLGMHDLAREQFEIAFGLDAGCSRQVLESFKHKFASNEPASAFPDWVEIREAYSNDPDVELMESIVFRLYGTPSDAESIYLHEIGKRRALHEINLEMSVYESGRKNFKRALELADNDLFAHLSDFGWLSKVRALNGLQQYQQALPLAVRLYRGNAFTIGAGQQLATAYMGCNKAQSAIAPAAINLFVWSSPEAVESAHKLLESVLASVPAGEIDAALKPAEQVASRAGVLPKYRLAMAETFVRMKMNSRALNELELAMAENSVDPKIYSLHASLLSGSPDDCQRAQASLQKSIQFDPLNVEYRKISERLSQRLANQPNDIAWRIKSALRH